MNEAQLLELNQNGLIPGPDESEIDFLRRVQQIQDRYSQGDWIPKAHLDWVALHLQELFDFRPAFLPVYYSGKGLAPWQGAASWIEGRTITSIQLREGLKKGSYLGLYRREEILAHEAVHAARCAFEEPKTEEFFAYMTSEKKWRRVLGPMVQRPWEVWPLFLFLMGGAVGPLGFERFGALCYWGAALWIGSGFFRLIRGHLRFRRASQQILKEVGDVRKARAILFRLTDKEMDYFSKGGKFSEYGVKQKCLRWKIIRLAYARGVTNA